MFNAKFVVRVILNPEESEQFGLMVTMFANCGVAIVHRQGDLVEGSCFDIPQESRVAAQMNADKMSSFGFNAVCAPTWFEFDSEAAQNFEENQRGFGKPSQTFAEHSRRAVDRHYNNIPRKEFDALTNGLTEWDAGRDEGDGKVYLLALNDSSLTYASDHPVGGTVIVTWTFIRRALDDGEQS